MPRTATAERVDRDSLLGEHPDWDEYRSAMQRQGKCLVRIAVEGWGPVATGGFPPGVVDKL